MSTVGMDEGLIRGRLLVEVPEVRSRAMLGVLVGAGLVLLGSGVMAGACVVALWGWWGLMFTVPQSLVTVAMMRRLWNYRKY